MDTRTTVVIATNSMEIETEWVDLLLKQTIIWCSVEVAGHSNSHLSNYQTVLNCTQAHVTTVVCCGTATPNCVHFQNTQWSLWNCVPSNIFTGSSRWSGSRSTLSGSRDGVRDRVTPSTSGGSTSATPVLHTAVIVGEYREWDMAQELESKHTSSKGGCLASVKSHFSTQTIVPQSCWGLMHLSVNCPWSLSHTQRWWRGVAWPEERLVWQAWTSRNQSWSSPRSFPSLPSLVSPPSLPPSSHNCLVFSTPLSSPTVSRQSDIRESPDPAADTSPHWGTHTRVYGWHNSHDTRYIMTCFFFYIAT